MDPLVLNFVCLSVASYYLLLLLPRFSVTKKNKINQPPHSKSNFTASVTKLVIQHASWQTMRQQSMTPPQKMQIIEMKTFKCV